MPDPSSTRVLGNPRLDLGPVPQDTLAGGLGEDRGREVVIAVAVGGNGGLGREAEELGDLGGVDEVVEFYLHDANIS
jgi:hypothetical protein